MKEQVFSKKYQIQREIACGGMGTIIQATDMKLGREVAIKMLHHQYSGETAFAQRFLREARAMAKLDHPNIIRIWSVEEEMASHYIVMEYFPGIDLKQLIRDRGPLPLTDALSFITQIIKGLTYAHSMGIIHRDIKPANILVDQEGKVKITDFGIAAAFNESSLTLDGSVIGTPEYMAPEQAKAEPVGPHSDLYSIGILLYELLTGQTPYKGMPAQTLIGKLAFDPENPTLMFPSHIPDQLQELIINLTKKEIEFRLQDTEEIFNIIESIQREIHGTQPKAKAMSSLTPETASYFSGSLQAESKAPSLSSQSSKQREKPSTPGNVKSPQNLKPILGAMGLLVVAAIMGLVFSQWDTLDLPNNEKVLPIEPLDQPNEQESITPSLPTTEEPTASEARQKSGIQLGNFPNKVQVLEKKITGMLQTFETSTQQYASQLSMIQKEIQQFTRDVSITPNANAMLKDLKKRNEAIQEKLQSLLSLETKQKDELQHSLTRMGKKHQQFEKEGLEPTQQAELTTLDTILKKSENQLKVFPPHSWKQLQVLSGQIQADLAAIELELRKKTQEQSQAAQQIEILTQQASQLNSDLQEFRVDTVDTFQKLRNQAKTYASKINSQKFSSQKEGLKEKIGSLDKSLKDLKESSRQQSIKHNQRIQSFVQRQNDLHENEQNFSQSSVEPNLANVQQTLQSVNKNLQDLQKLNWKELEDKITQTQVALNQTHESLKQANLQKLQRKRALAPILDEFATAYTNQDLLHLKLTTSMSQSRTRNLDLMFKSYSVIELHIDIISISDSQATAKIFIDKLINQDGQAITPNAIIRETTISIPQKDGKWGKIQW